MSKSIFAHKQKNLVTFICTVCGKQKRISVFDDELPDKWDENLDGETICPECQLEETDE